MLRIRKENPSSYFYERQMLLHLVTLGPKRLADSGHWSNRYKQRVPLRLSRKLCGSTSKWVMQSRYVWRKWTAQKQGGVLPSMHTVHKEDSTTSKLHMVFNASAKTASSLAIGKWPSSHWPHSPPSVDWCFIAVPEVQSPTDHRCELHVSGS